jgi:hypothetical protein
MARRVSCAALILVAATLWVPPASAQDAAVAEVLFEQGRALMQQGRYDEACPKFDESQRVAPSAGALLNLGECYAKLGKTASAWAAFKGAVGAAQGAGQTERESYARERARELEDKLVRLTVTVPAAVRVPGLAITRDGVDLGSAVWGTPVPTDPGVHELVAVAPGKKPWKRSVRMSPESKLESVTVPPLEDQTGHAPEPPPASITRPAATDAPSQWPAQRTAAIVVGAVGIAGVGVGTFFGVNALGAKSDASAHCPTTVTCDAEGFARGKDAHAAATASTILFLVGGAAVGVGAVLWLTAPSAAPGPTVGLRVGPGTAAVEGTW